MVFLINNIEEWREKLQTTDKLIIVEGKKDKKALTELGITNIFMINKPMYKLIEEIANYKKEVIILTDFDREGKRLYGVLRTGLQKNGIRVDRNFREFLKNNTKLSCIEGIEKLFLF